MPEINFRWSFLLITCLVVVTASAFSHSLSLRPTHHLPFTKINSLSEVSSRLNQSVLRAESKTIGIGYPKSDAKTETMINEALASLPETTRVISGGSLKINRPHEQIDLLQISKLNQALSRRPIDGSTILVLPSIFVSHRMGKNWATDYEQTAHEKISAFILGEVALRTDEEKLLSPACYTSQRQGAGLTYDLGCLILAVSRTAQASKLDPKSIWLAIEQEMPNETLFSVYVPVGSNHE